MEKFIFTAEGEAKGRSVDTAIVIHEKLARLAEMVGGYDFAHVIGQYWRGQSEGNQDLKAHAIRWLRGEYTTKTDARLAQTLGNSLRPTDLLGRLSERTFLAVLTECKANEIESVAKRLTKMVSYTEIKWWGDKVSVTASFGGTSSAEGDTVDSIVSRAEAALRAGASASGRGIKVLV